MDDSLIKIARAIWAIALDDWNFEVNDSFWEKLSIKASVFE